jgi:hypothetical protein
MKTNFFTFFLFFLFILTGCQKKSNLDVGEIIMNDKEAFGKIIELKGRHLLTDSMMDPRIRGMLLKEDKLIFQYDNDPPLVIYQFPDMKYITKKGYRGNGPDEFVYPSLVPTSDPNLICYIYETTNQKLYTLDNNYQIKRSPFDFPKGMFEHNNRQLINIGKNEFLSEEISTGGKSIYRLAKTNDSTQVEEIYNLNLNPDLDFFGAYYGCLAANEKRNRMVYAYQFYKVISFMDLDGKNVRTINFKQSEYDESTRHVADGLDLNVTNYWGICAQPDYVYALYIGQKPAERMAEGTSSCFIEQYDWDGNPIRKFKLNRTGRFVVDEKNKRLYLSDWSKDDPIYVYTLQK